jgi:hypothetical protein
MRRCILVLLLAAGSCSFLFAGENIQDFPTRFAVSFSNRINYIQYQQDWKTFTKLSPVALGLGFSWKNSVFNISAGLPVYTGQKSTTLDFQFKYCGPRIYGEVYFKYYDRFRKAGSERNNTTDMSILAGGISAQYVFNYKNHSIGSVYELNKAQLKSSGSFLLGADVSLSAMKSHDSTFSIDQNDFVIFGPAAGCSYTWIFRRAWFLNLMFTGQANLGIHYKTGCCCFEPRLLPTLGFGYHGKTWSFNLVGALDAGVYVKGKSGVDALITAQAGFTVSKRF